MAKRYRYSFAKLKPAANAVVSVSLAAASFLLFLAAVGVSFFSRLAAAPLIGGICVFAALLAVYGFILGMKSFSQKSCSHGFSTAGAIANGILMVGWLGIYLMGV